jgi:hypothetical protein
MVVTLISNSMTENPHPLSAGQHTEAARMSEQLPAIIEPGGALTTTADTYTPI